MASGWPTMATAITAGAILRRMSRVRSGVNQGGKAPSVAPTVCIPTTALPKRELMTIATRLPVRMPITL